MGADPALLYSTYCYGYPSVYSDFTAPTSTAPTTDPMLDITILARGLLRLRPRLRLTPLSSTAPMAMVIPVFTLDFTTPTSMAPTTDPMVDITILARDLLKLSLLLRLLLILRLVPTFSTAMAIPTPMVMPVFITPMPTAPIITDLMDMPTGDKRLSESSQKKYKTKPSTLFVEQLLHYTPEWTNIHQLHPLFLNL